MKKRTPKKAKRFSGFKPSKKFKPSPYKAEPLSKAFKTKAVRKKVKKAAPPPPKPQPQPKKEKEEIPMATEPKKEEKTAKEHPKIESVKDVISRVAGKIRNLENAVNASRSTPPDPELAAQFDGIQADLDTIKNAE